MGHFRTRIRAGLALRASLAALPILLALPLLGGALLPRSAGFRRSGGPLTWPVRRSDFVHRVTAKGFVESADNVEIRCEVDSSVSWRATILQLVPEGTFVQPGDFLVRLDSAPLEEMCAEQQIDCNTSAAALAQAISEYETALKAKEEYFHGQFRLEKERLEGEVLVAEQQHRRAQEYLEHSERLFAQGYVTKRELEADQFAARKALIELNLARLKLESLEKFTKAKMEKQLDCRIITTRARLEAAKYRHQTNLERLQHIKDQIAKCLITSPGAGQVVYVHLHHSDHSHLIEEGATLFRNQVIFRLPNPEQMQIKAMINEDKVALIEPGMPVTVQLNAFPELELTGVVQKVNEYPEPTSFWGPNLKQFETIITLDEHVADLRPGLSAEAAICAQRLENQLQVPTQAVLRHGGREYCLTHDAGGFRAHEVQTGSSNGKFVVIREGLKQGQQVVLGPGAYRDKVDLPPASGGT